MPKIVRSSMCNGRDASNKHIRCSYYPVNIIKCGKHKGIFEPIDVTNVATEFPHEPYIESLRIRRRSG